MRKITNAPSEHKMKDIHTQLEAFFSENYEIRFNVLTDQNEFRRAGSDGPFQPLTQREANGIAMEVYKSGIDCIDCDVLRYINSPLVRKCNPIRAYLEKLPQWDGVDRLKKLAQIVDKSVFWTNKFRRWMMAMVAQWLGLDKKYGNCIMPILISADQGKHKSTFCKMILPPELRNYYCDDFDINAQAGVTRKMAHYALINIDEINRLSDVKMAKLKTILQRSELSLPHRTDDGFVPRERMASFIATTNFKDILTDSSGARREVPIEVKRRIRALRMNYDQLYAQIKEALLTHKERYWFTTAEEARLTIRNKAYCRRPAEEALFFHCFLLPKEEEEGTRFTLTQIFEILKEKSKATMRDITMNAFRSHLAMIGAKSIHTKRGAVYQLVKI
jgi:predicted P-loop ATPase